MSSTQAIYETLRIFVKLKNLTLNNKKSENQLKKSNNV